MKLISVVTPCFNEEGNAGKMVEEVRKAFQGLPQYEYEHIFIDNASRDGTVAELKAIAREDRRVKIIVNTRNFGHVRSPYHALLQARGEAVVCLAADLQDPPSLIPEFLARWESGFKVVLGVKESGDESWLMSRIRGAYYDLISRLSDVEMIKNATGFGLYDRVVVEILRGLDEPYPYVRGLIPEIGHEWSSIAYHKPLRRTGVTKNDFFTLYDLAMTGITAHSKIPLRLATMTGFGLSLLSFLLALGYLVAKLLFWNHFPFGTAPLLIGIFLSFSVQLFFIGLVGEYVAAVHTRTVRRPLVVEKERVNFD